METKSLLGVLIWTQLYSLIQADHLKCGKKKKGISMSFPECVSKSNFCLCSEQQECVSHLSFCRSSPFGINCFSIKLICTVSRKSPDLLQGRAKSKTLTLPNITLQIRLCTPYQRIILVVWFIAWRRQQRYFHSSDLLNALTSLTKELLCLKLFVSVLFSFTLFFAGGVKKFWIQLWCYIRCTIVWPGKYLFLLHITHMMYFYK